MQTRQQIILETIDNLMELAPDHPKFRNTPKTPEQQRKADELKRPFKMNPDTRRPFPIPDSGKVQIPGTGNRPRFPNLDPGFYRPNRPELPSGLLPGGRSPDSGMGQYYPPSRSPDSGIGQYYPPSRLPGGRFPGRVPMPNPNRPGRPEYRPGFGDRPGRFPGGNNMGPAYPPSRLPGGGSRIAYPSKPGDKPMDFYRQDMLYRYDENRPKFSPEAIKRLQQK